MENFIKYLTNEDNLIWARAIIGAFYRSAEKKERNNKELFFSYFKGGGLIIMSPEVKKIIIGGDCSYYNIQKISENVLVDGLFPIGYMVVTAEKSFYVGFNAPNLTL